MDNVEMFRMIHQAIMESNEDLTEKIDGVRTELTAKIDDVRTELTAKIDDVRTELTAKIDRVSTELIANSDAVNERFDKLDTDMEHLKSKFFEHDRDIFALKKRI